MGKGIWELSANFQDEYTRDAKEASLKMIQIAKKRGSNHFEWQHARKGDRIFYADVNLKHIVQEGKDVFVASVRDISKRKQLEHDLKEMTRTADESSQQKLEFLSNMSHEIRSPLNVIIGFTELLEFTDINHDEYREYAGIIRANGNMLQRLIDDIIDISKIETNKLKVIKKDVDVNDLMNETFQSLSLNGSEGQVEMKLSIPESKRKIHFHSDPYRLKQILTNLITNAQKFTTEGSIEIGYHLEDKGRIEFFVSDTGKGIAENDLKLIFSRFEQGNTIDINEVKGFGLGLAISRGLTQMMGGKISVESELGKGSKFYFSFPLEAKQEKENKKRNSNYPDLNGIRILIAEDVYENFEFLNTILKRTNAHITWAKNGQEAFEYVKNDPFDLVLMDIKMPIMDGYQALEQIRKTHKSLPIIAQTAYALDYDKSRGIAAGFNDYISKPIRIDLLFQKISTILNLIEEDKR
jgi:signal transduction histidine kinase